MITKHWPNWQQEKEKNQSPLDVAMVYAGCRMEYVIMMRGVREMRTHTLTIVARKLVAIPKRGRAMECERFET